MSVCGVLVVGIFFDILRVRKVDVVRIGSKIELPFFWSMVVYIFWPWEGGCAQRRVHAKEGV